MDLDYNDQCDLVYGRLRRIAAESLTEEALCVKGLGVSGAQVDMARAQLSADLDKDKRIAELEAVLAMTAGRLGGSVEGAPTHRSNFLQRIDALRAREFWLESLADKKSARIAELEIELRVSLQSNDFLSERLKTAREDGWYDAFNPKAK